MKQLIFIGNHPGFNAMRLAAPLARTLQAGGADIVLGGLRTKLPKESSVPTLAFAPTAAAKTWAAALKKAGIERVISLASLPICQAAALAGIAYIYCEPENFKEEKVVKDKKTLLKRAQKVIVLGEGSKALDKKRYSTNAVRVKTPAVWVHHASGLRPQTFKKANNIVAAAAAKDAALDAMLAAWTQLAPLHPSWHLTLCVPAARKAVLQKWIAKQHLQDAMELYLDTEMTPLLAHADIYVQGASLPAEQLVDAMASTLPVIAFAGSGAEELITPDADGALLPQAEAAALKEVLDGLMVNWGKRVGMAVQAGKMKDRFPFEVFASFFE